MSNTAKEAEQQSVTAMETEFGAGNDGLDFSKLTVVGAVVDTLAAQLPESMNPIVTNLAESSDESVADRLVGFVFALAGQLAEAENSFAKRMEQIVKQRSKQ